MNISGFHANAGKTKSYEVMPQTIEKLKLELWYETELYDYLVARLHKQFKEIKKAK